MKKATATKTTKTFKISETVKRAAKNGKEKAEADSTPLIPAEIKEKAANQARNMKVIVTGSTNGKLQQRVTGERVFRNAFGHYTGTIGSKIDDKITAGTCTKNELAALAGTKMSKINSHIAHLRRDCKVNVIINPVNKKVSIG